MSKIILGLAGEMATGKGTATKYLVEKYRGVSYRFSTMLRDLLNRLYLPQSRENMQMMSTIMRQNFGEDVLAKVMAEDAKNDKADIIVIEGIRRLADIKYLRELPEFKLAYIEADIKKCYERILTRGENPDDGKKSFDQFQKEHEHESELQIKELKNHADFVIDNNGSLDDLYGQVDKILFPLLR